MLILRTDAEVYGYGDKAKQPGREPGNGSKHGGDKCEYSVIDPWAALRAICCWVRGENKKPVGHPSVRSPIS